MKLYRLALPALALVLGASALLIAQEGPPQGPPDRDHQHFDQDRDHQHFDQDRDHHDFDHDRGGWDAPPPEFHDIQRRGFHDGIEAARDDRANHRYPDVNRRREFRHPPAPRFARDDYRQAFHRGYDMAVSHFGNWTDRR